MDYKSMVFAELYGATAKPAHEKLTKTSLKPGSFRTRSGILTELVSQNSCVFYGNSVTLRFADGPKQTLIKGDIEDMIAFLNDAKASL